MVHYKLFLEKLLYFPHKSEYDVYRKVVLFAFGLERCGKTILSVPPTFSFYTYFVKPIQKAQGFAGDFSNLYSKNQRRFWQGIAKSAEAKAHLEALQYI